MKTVRIVLAAVMAAAVLALCGCGGSEKAVDITKLAPKIIDGLEWQEEPMEVTSDSVLQNYYFVDMADVEYFALYRSSSGATAEETAVFQAKDAEAAARVEEAVRTRVEDMKFSFENYIPAELPKIENAVVFSEGCFVVLVTNNDDAAALDIVKSFFG